MQSKVLFQTESVGSRQLLTTALRTKLGATLLFGVGKLTTATTAYFRCLSLHVRMQKWRGQDKFLSALPRPPAGPLAVEEHFYILWPTVVHRITARRLAWISAFIAFGIPLARAASFSLGWKNGLDWYTWYAADGLAVGSLLAIILRTSINRTQVRNLAGLLMATALFLAFAGRPFGIIDRNRVLGAAFQWTLLNLLFAGVVLLFLWVGSGEKKRYVNIGILRFLGYISYGLYLDHLLAFRMYDRICRHYLPQLARANGHFELVLLRFAVAGAGAIGVAYLSRRFFEEKFLRLKDTLVPRLTGVPSDPPQTELSAAGGRVA